ncbi:acetyl-CoA C-acetyltransferase [Rhodococcus sp. PAMC28707]|uniref:acetyl-CoA C-acetyltransferase n=1 Tax=unclassified Rhodococcus (in: high G+C Gram-positive bacteria) TaxID=192944 RepID=UPI00109E1573|nr:MULTISPECIES: acetyl-CoA C-acetyltransferase [unclassified Rhodococcus (in: high G+C Gram-positive bacteria)]QCB50247.1 acetyl-CoA C-acetyltransferase [Rhodococcus sp. PAMC28705]QCB58061.1 acetyl-CoA C-acetyltransferase [Rhodococcus sp. PAMC28707]
MPEAVIVSAARSPIGRARKGSLKDLRADDLAATIIHAALDKIPAFDPRELTDIMIGCAQPAGEQGYGLARVISVLLGYDTVPGTTVQRYCASSLQTTRMAFHAIRAGEGDAFISGGVEMVSRFGLGKSDGMPDTKNSKFAAPAERAAAQAGSTWTDPREEGLVPDVYLAMGETAENVAGLRSISRREQDEYAALSQARAQESIASGFFDREITPVQTPDGQTVSRDDGPRAGVDVDSLSTLKPVFRPDGTVTAGNCCPVNDGAAALVIMSEQRAKDLGIEPLARILSTSVSGISPEIMGLSPVEATRRAVASAGLNVSDVDLFEINEAFAAQVIPSYRDLGVDVDRVNVHGGAIALGHPFGMTGARMTATLLNALSWGDKEIGVETMCAAGGQGMAMVVQRLK